MSGWMWLLTIALVPGQAPPAAVMPRVGNPAPPVVFADEIAGPTVTADASRARAQALTLDALRGKVVVLDFFATWCAPCVASIPRTNALIEGWRDLPVVVLAVANEERGPLEQLVAERPMSARLVLDAAGQTYKNYWISGLPFVAIIDPQGRVSRFTHPDQLTRAMIEQALGRK